MRDSFPSSLSMKSLVVVGQQSARLDAHRLEGGDGFGLTLGVPRRPATRMDPGMAGAGHAERQQDVPGAVAAATGETAARGEVHEVAIQPFGDAALERLDPRPGCAAARRRTRRCPPFRRNRRASPRRTTCPDRPRSRATISALCCRTASSTSAGGSEAAVSTQVGAVELDFDTGSARRPREPARRSYPDPPAMGGADGRSSSVALGAFSA